jgi:hypothetical protein
MAEDDREIVKTGLSIDEAVYDEVTDPLEFGDAASPRIEDLVVWGLAVEEAFDRAEDLDVEEAPASVFGRRDLLRSIVDDAAETWDRRDE